MYLPGILCLVAAAAALPVLPDPPTLPNPVAAARQDSKIHSYIHKAATASAPIHDGLTDAKDNEEVKKDMLKIASVVSSPPRQLHPFIYYILKKQKADGKDIHEETVKQKNESSKEEKESIIPKEPLEVEFLTDSITGLQNSEDYGDILIKTSDSTRVKDKKNDETVKNNIVIIPSILIPTLPEQGLFDYSVLKKQIDDQKSYDAVKHAKKSQKEKEAIIPALKKSAPVKVPKNLAIYLASLTAPQNSEDHTIILSVNSDSDPVANKSDDEEVSQKMVKKATPPPELTPFDYSILRKQKTDLNLKSDYSAKQAAEKYKEKKQTVILYLEKPIKVEVPQNLLIDSVATLPVSEVRATILSGTDEFAPLADKKYDEKIKHNSVKITTVAMPPPPELTPFDYSILRKQKADRNLKSEYSAKQAAEKYKEKKQTVILDLEKPIKVGVPQNLLIDSVATLPVSEVRATIPSGTDEFSPLADKKYDEKIKHNSVKITTVAMPPPPELPMFDNSVSKTPMTPNPATLIDSVISPQDSENRATIPSGTDEFAPLAVKKYDEKIKHNTVKITTVAMPPPPELTSFDYSILRKQNTGWNPQFEYSAKQAANKYKEEKQVVILDLEKPVKVEMPPNPPTLPESVGAFPVSKAHMNILNEDTDAAPEVDINDNEEVKMNKDKIASTVIPTPPELPPFDYSILRKQKADRNLKSEYSAKQAVEKYKEKKQTVILDLEKPIKVEVPQNPLIDSVATLPVSEVISDSDNEEAKMNMMKIASIVIPPPPELPMFDNSVSKTPMTPNPATLIDSVITPQVSEVRATIPSGTDEFAPLADKKYDEKIKHNSVKITTVAMPPPPELTPFDYSILRKQKTGWNPQSEYSAKQAANKYKEEKQVVILDLEKPVKVEMPPNPPTLPESVGAYPVSKVHMNILNVDTDAAPEVDINDNEEVKMNKDKIASTVISPPPELPPFDYSILRKQKTGWNPQSEYSAKQAANKYKEEKQVVILDLEKPVKVEKPPNPPTLPESVGAYPVSKVHMNILNEATDAAPEVDINDKEEVKMNMDKIASTVIPTPPELPPFDYSILRKQKADRNLKSEYSAKQAVEKYKEKKQTVILDLEKPIKVGVPQNLLIDSVATLPVSEVRATIPSGTDEFSSLADKKYDEKIKHHSVKITTVAMPPPPELTPFDYSILRKQKTGWNPQSEYSAKQAANKYKEEKQVVILDLEKPVKVEMPPNPPTLPESVGAYPVSKVHMNILNVDTDAAPEVDINDNEEVKMNKDKIASTVISPPPELPPFDYSILRKQKTGWNPQSEYSAKQAANKYKEEKQVVILDLEKPVKVEKPPNPPTLPESVGEYPVSKVHMNILNEATDAAPEVDINDNEEVKMNMDKIASTVIPTPPELPPFDYSILRKQKTGWNPQSEYSAKQAANKYKEEKQVVILDLEKPVKVEMPPNPPTLPESVGAYPVSKVHMNILNVDTDAAPEVDINDNEEVKMNEDKIASTVISPPPELPPFDYSILRKQKTGWNPQSEYSAKQAANKYKEEKQVVILDLEKPVKVEKPPNPPTLPESVGAYPVSKMHMNILNVDTDAAPEVDINDNEEVKMNKDKIASTVISPPPELPPFDYSILRKQKTGWNPQSEYSAKQAANKYKEEKQVVILDLEKPVKVEKPPNPPTLPESVGAYPVSKVHMNILNEATDAAPEVDINDNEEVKMNMDKIASTVIPTPPELPPFDYSILRKQKTGWNPQSEYSAKQAANKYKEEKQVVILDLEKPVKVEKPPNPPTLPESVGTFPVSKVHMNILNEATDAAPEDDINDKEEVKINKDKIASTVIPTPPELPPFDYSILRKQKADRNLKSEYSAKQAVEKYKEKKQTVILDLEKPIKVEVPLNPLIDSVATLPVSEVISDSDNEEAKMNMMKIASIVIPPPPELPMFDNSVSKTPMTPNPATLIDSVITPQVSEVRATIPSGTDEFAPLADKKYDEKIKHNSVKITTVAMPPPPELTPFDYSILRKQKTGWNPQSEYSAKQAANKHKEEKQVVILDLEKPVKVEMPPNPPTLPESVGAYPVSKVHMNILNEATDAAPEVDINDKEEVKMNMDKIASTVIPTPPELPPFDYSILRKQKADRNLKSEYSAKQAAEKYKEKKQTVILDLEKPIKVGVPQNLLIDSVATLPVSEVRATIPSGTDEFSSLADKKYDEKIKHHSVKITTVAMPPPPELTPFDYSILRKQKTGWNPQSEYSAKQAANKYKEEKQVVILDLEKPVKVEMPPNPPTLPESVGAYPVSKVHMNILNVDTDAAPEVDINDNEEVKMNKDKIASTVISPPPELPPFDYSILRKQKTGWNPQSEYSAKQAANKYKEEKQVVILDLEKPVKVEKPPNPPTLPESVGAYPVSKMHMNILNVDTDAAPEVDINDNEEVKMNKDKIASTVISPPPELPPFDYSILRKQKTGWNPQSEYSAKQAANKYKEEKQVVILDLEKAVKVEKPPNPPTLPESVGAYPVSKVHMNILNEATDAAPEVDINDKEEVKMNMDKIASTVIPTPPELPPFDYSILRKQKADRNLKSEYSAKQAAEKYKEKKQTVILDLEKPIKVGVPQNLLIDSVATLPVSEVRATIPSGTDEFSSLADKKYDEKIKHHSVKITTVAMPPPPELTPFDYSILRKQKTGWNPQSEYSAKQAANKYKEEKQVVILDLEKPVKVEMPPNPPTLPESVGAYPVSKVHMNILNVDTDAAPEVDINDNEEVKMNKDKIASTVISPLPELPPFDYSILRKQKTGWNPQSEYSAKQAANKYKEEKQVVILDLEKPVKVEKPPNPPTLPESVGAYPVSKMHMNILNVDTDAAPEVDINDNEEVKMNKDKIASTVISPPPELPPFDYSILRKQKTDRDLESEYSAKQAAEKYKEKKQTVILDLEKPIKVKLPKNPLPDSAAALPISEVINDSDNEEGKMNMMEIPSIVIPSAAEEPLFDYSILKKQIADRKQKSIYILKQEAAKSNKGKAAFIIEKPVEVKVEEPKLIEVSKFVEVSKPMMGSKPVEESKPKEELKKEPVKHLQDIPVVIKWNTPIAPFLSKLISNCPPLPTFGLNWPLQRPSMYRCPRLIYPKFDVDGIINSN